MDGAKSRQLSKDEERCVLNLSHGFNRVCIATAGKAARVDFKRALSFHQANRSRLREEVGGVRADVYSTPHKAG